MSSRPSTLFPLIKCLLFAQVASMQYDKYSDQFRQPQRLVQGVALEIAPAAIEKINSSAVARRLQTRGNSQNESLALGRCPPDCNTTNEREHAGNPIDALCLSTGDSAIRYTIFTRHGPSSDGHPAYESQIENVEIRNVIPTTVENLIHHRAPSQPVQLTDLDVHEGQPARVKVPFVGGDLGSRLEGLKKFKVWGERLHDTDARPSPKVLSSTSTTSVKTTQDIDYALFNFANIETLSPKQISLNKVGVSSQKLHPESVGTKLEAAQTPSSSSQAIISHSKAVETVKDSSQPLVSSLLSALESPNQIDDANQESQTARSRSTSKSFVISATPKDELVRLSRSRSRLASRHHSRELSRVHARPKEHKYPPISFPKWFNDSYAEIQDRSNLLKSQQTSKPGSRALTPSVSPLKQAVSDGNTANTDPTSYDKPERPNSYSTIHYFTECPHSCSPADRPIDSTAQPRQDPGFNPIDSEISWSMIPGMCFNCDTFHRRAQESVVIESHVERICELKYELANLLGHLETDSESDEDIDPVSDRHGALLHAPHQFPEDVHDLHHQLSKSSLPPISDDELITDRWALKSSRANQQSRTYLESLTISKIRQIEAAIDKERDAQDINVQAIWGGYTRRWGSATLGAHKGVWATEAEAGRPRGDVTSYFPPEEKHQSALLRAVSKLNLNVVPDTNQLQETNTVSLGDGKRQNHSLRRTAGRTVNRGRGSVKSRSRTPSRAPKIDPAHMSQCDVPPSRTPDEGGVTTGWIREDTQRNWKGK